ncbi:MAG: ATP-binding protein [Alphaproteobacteria bacterium]|nr:ATP-binding protein [Alphaproteobacteria bacterium]
MSGQDNRRNKGGRAADDGFHRRMVDRITIGIFRSTLDGRYISANPAGFHMHGYESEQAFLDAVQDIGREIYVEPSDREKAQRDIAREGRLEPFECEIYRHITRERVWTRQQLALYTDPATGECWLEEHVEDIDARMRAEQELHTNEQRFRDFTEVAADWSWEQDKDLNFSWISDRFRELTGTDPASSYGKPRRAFLIDDVDEAVIAEHEAVLNARKPFTDFRYPRLLADGREVVLSVSGKPIYDDDGAFIGYRGAARDISERVEAERRAQQALEQAEQANAAKSVFLSSMSHELRTPLNSVIGFSQILLADRDAPLSADQTAAVEQIFKSGAHLLELINQVLDLSQIERGALSVSTDTLAVEPILEECLAMVRRSAEAAGLTFRLPQRPMPSVVGDPVRIKQVLLNLLANAVKYNRGGSRVELFWDVAPTAPSVLRLTVRDDGPGIPSEKHRDVFTPFNRLGIEALGIEGSGIGLAISKELVALMGGEIGFESQPGLGSAFWFTLPLAEAQTLKTVAAPAPAYRDRASVMDRRVLYIEDNEPNMHLMRILVSQIGGVDFLGARTAEEGVSVARQALPDLILMDVNLPGMPGDSALKRLKEAPETATIPVAAVSAAAMPSDIEAGLEAGFDRYFTKPIDVAALRAYITETLAPPGRRDRRARS